nr:hypothetical protein [Tanacetum cinerariifolium]
EEASTLDQSSIASLLMSQPSSTHEEEDYPSPFEELSDIRSPRANDHEHLMLPEMLEDPYVEVALQAPPSPDYIPGPEEPEQAPPSPDYSPEYVPESDFEAHPEDDDDEDPEEDPVDYPGDGGDDGDDEEESSEDDEDDDMDVEADEEEEKEEEHPAPADSVVVASTAADHAPSMKETEPFKIDESAATPPPHPAYHMTARISILAPVPMPAWTDSEVVRLLVISSPPALPLSPWSSPPPQIPFPPLPPILSPPLPILSPAPPPSPIRSLGYRAAMIRLRDEAASTSSLPLQLEKRLGITLGPRYDVGESSSAAARAAGGLMVDYGFVATMDREIMRDLEREVGYGITDSWDEIVETLQGAPVSTDTELGGYETDCDFRVAEDRSQEIYKDYRVKDSPTGTGDSPTGTEADEEKEEEEHPAPADSVVVTPIAADQVPSAEETEPFETDESAATPPPHPAYRTTARISIPAPVPMPAWTDSEVIRLLAISSPPASPLSPWSSPPPQIPSPPLPPMLSPPSPILAPAPPPSPIRSLGYRASMIRLRDEAASTSHLPPNISYFEFSDISHVRFGRIRGPICRGRSSGTTLSRLYAWPRGARAGTTFTRFIPGPEHADDEIIAEDQPYAEDASPIAQSLEYVPESDFEMHPEDDDGKDPEEDPVDYPVDGEDDSDDEEESSEDEEDDEMDVEADEEE